MKDAVQVRQAGYVRGLATRENAWRQALRPEINLPRVQKIKGSTLLRFGSCLT